MLGIDMKGYFMKRISCLSYSMLLILLMSALSLSASVAGKTADSYGSKNALDLKEGKRAPDKTENCRLFGAVSGDSCVMEDVREQLLLFAQTDSYQRSGWAAACYDNVEHKGLLGIPGYPLVIRSPVPINEDQEIFCSVVELMIRYDPEVIVAHLRNATSGCSHVADPHPFLREVRGKWYTFSHNGTVWGDDLAFLIDELVQGWSEPLNCPTEPIDTEYLFLYLCRLLGETELDEQEALHLWATNLISGFSDEWSALNVVISDGETIWGVRCTREGYGFPLNYCALDLERSGYVISTDVLSPQDIPIDDHRIIELRPYEHPRITEIAE